MLQNRFNTTKGLDDIRSVSVQVPQLSVVSLAGPPEGVTLHQLVLLELRSKTEALVETERAPVLLEEGVDTGKTTVPAVLQVLQRQTAILLLSFLSLLRVFDPHPLRVDEFGFPGDNVTEDIGDQGLLVVRHTRSEMGNTGIRLLGPPLVASRNQDVRSRNHTKTSQFLGGIEHRRRETRRHLGVQPDLDTGLNLGLTFDNGIQQIDSRHSTFTVVGEKRNQGSVPLVSDLGKSRRSRRHEDLPNPVVELLNVLLGNLEEGVGRTLLAGVVDQRPNAILDRELLILVPALG